MKQLRTLSAMTGGDGAFFYVLSANGICSKKDTLFHVQRKFLRGKTEHLFPMKKAAAMNPGISPAPILRSRGDCRQGLSQTNGPKRRGAAIKPTAAVTICKKIAQSSSAPNGTVRQDARCSLSR